MLWVLKRTVSMRRFFWAPKTYAKNYGLENICNFTLNIFVYLNLWNHIFSSIPRIYVIYKIDEFTLQMLFVLSTLCREGKTPDDLQTQGG